MFCDPGAELRQDRLRAEGLGQEILQAATSCIQALLHPSAPRNEKCCLGDCWGGKERSWAALLPRAPEAADPICAQLAQGLQMCDRAAGPCLSLRPARVPGGFAMRDCL